MIEQAKKQACIKALDEQLLDAKTVGIGSGSTIVYLVQELGKRVKGGLVINACVPTSHQAKQLIIENGLPLATLEQFPMLDVCFDGADQVDESLNVIKGGGGCHLLEKLIMFNSKRRIIVVDYRKKGGLLTITIPVEVIPQAYVSVQMHLEAMSFKQTLRLATRKAGPVVSDNGNFIIDVDCGKISHPRKIEQDLKSIVGVVEVGLFCGMVECCYFGLADGTVESASI